MMTIRCLGLFFFSIVVSVHAHADIYRCKDSSGQMVTADRPLPECAEKATQIYSNSGVLKSELAGARTAEQRHAQEVEQQEREKQRQQQAENQKEIRYLTTHYPTVKDIDNARQKELNAIDAKIVEEKKNIDTTKIALRKNQSDQTFLKNKTTELMHAKNEENNLNQTIQQSERLIQRYSLEKINVKREFDQIYQRYVEIVTLNNE